MDSPTSLFNNPDPDSILSTKYLDADYLFGWMVDIFQFIFRQETYNLLKVICIILSLFFITLILYCIVRMFEIRKKEHDHLHHEIHEYAIRQAEKEKKAKTESASHNERWVSVLQYIFSVNPGDWKLAVIEADSMLEALLEQLGFKGETLGDKLKAADPEKFKALPIAWEVHTVRNRIAHEGSSFALSAHEAKRIVALYEQIFRPYGYI